jgi:hypothetical protein
MRLYLEQMALSEDRALRMPCAKSSTDNGQCKCFLSHLLRSSGISEATTRVPHALASAAGIPYPS